MTTTALVALPDPRDMPLADVRAVLPQRVAAAREAIREEGGGVREADRLRRQLEALRAYVDDQQASQALAVESRRTEILIGEFLGPAPGSGTDENASAGVLHHARRREFRLLYEFRREVEGWLFQGISDRPGLLQRIKRLGAGQATDEAVQAGEGVPLKGPLYHLLHRELDDAIAEVDAESIDLIVTDPPYPWEFLATHESLAKFAAHALKPGGSLLAMVGHIYLPEILDLMRPHMTYHWTMAYLVPGVSKAVWSRHALIGWKPVLWFVKGTYRGGNVPDVYRSDRVDKGYHDWGQSERGIDDLLHRFAGPHDLVCDPFVGGGATAVVALLRGCRFLGIDRDQRAIQATAGRIAALDLADV